MYSIFRSNGLIKSCLILTVAALCLGYTGRPGTVFAKTPPVLREMIGRKDALRVTDPRGRILFSKHDSSMLIPASILKIFTALVGMHYLGPEYRFPTDFYLTADSDLIVRGYGDPLLISEVLSEIARELSSRLQTRNTRPKTINHLVLDDSYFSRSIVIPGIGASTRPHDAPNGALSANFNTVSFKQGKGTYVSAEPHTPLLPSALAKIERSGLSRGRIIYSRREEENLLYAGELLLHFLKKEGMSLRGGIRVGRASESAGRLIYRYTSMHTLKQIVSKLLEYSNNFMANQILIASGAKAYGPPGTLKKGVAAAMAYAKNVLKTEGLTVVEGSGISRKNRISAAVMDNILDVFSPHHSLLRRRGRVYYKTGTLLGINTRAGYIEGDTGRLHRFVIMLNSSRYSSDRILERVLEMVR